MISVDTKNEGIMRSYTGHGMIEKHPAGLTIAGVMGHELGHVNEAKNLALAGGETVISQNIQINVEFEGSRLVATSGRATTVSARANPAANYKNNMDNFQLESAQKSNVNQPIKSLYQLKQANLSSAANANASVENSSAKAAELSSVLSQQKQKLENKIQQLSAKGLNTAPFKFNETPIEKLVFSNNDETQKAAAAGTGAGANNASAARDMRSQSQVTEQLASIKEQIAKIDNMMASIKIARSVQMLDNLLQAVAGVGGVSGGDIASGGSAAASSNFTASSNVTQAPANRKSAIENMISLIEESLRGMMVNLKA